MNAVARYCIFLALAIPVVLVATPAATEQQLTMKVWVACRHGQVIAMRLETPKPVRQLQFVIPTELCAGAGPEPRST
jgi:hypothetical protein